MDPVNATNYYTEHLLGLFVAAGLNDPSKNTGYLLQGGLGMPDREYYLSADKDMAKKPRGLQNLHRRPAQTGRPGRCHPAGAGHL